MSDPRTLKLALELVARVVGREELQGLLTELEALGPGSAQAATATTTLTDAQEALQQSLPESSELLAQSTPQWQGWGQQLAAVVETLLLLDSRSTQAAQRMVSEQQLMGQATRQSADGAAELAKAFAVLGLDFERANGRIGEGFQKTIGALDVLVAHTGASSAAIEEALAAAYNSAKTTAEIDAVIARQKQLAAQGKITGDALARSMAIAADAMAKVKGGSGDTARSVAAIGDGFDEAAARAKSATDAMRSGLKWVQDEAKQTNASLASSGGGGGRGDITRTVNAGSFYYKSVDINSLRGNAEGLAGVEEELARYSQKVKDIPAYSEWSKYYGEKFQKEMEAMQARLKEELNKALAKESAKTNQAATQPPASAVAPSTPGTNTPGTRRPLSERITIELKGAGGAAELQADEANANALISLLKQQGLRQ
ncbi:hypothetical protein [Aeromonas veronii]|uniref:hypothetical protein n=1 Tax=Aeromonas veronii TaxID=654 RepID=UPI000206A80E|nr:hypothetical protein [Aeromonas veronii]AEB49316.1 hypothetical protein B565_1281 [Aeromonas veronii B565]EKB13175.1 hypothetical protein HMPREF1169_02401 [Aeromonas veronii AER397]MBS4690067.1 hypothetical protein [Aeromonas veronii bv. veronii]OKP39501.1 hypothetical protein BJP23_01255 [Aeromonas veronii bv. veronii]